MSRIIFAAMTVAWLALTQPAQAQFTFKAALKKIEARFEPQEARPGQTVTLKVSVELNEGWYTYATFQPDPNVEKSANVIVLPPPGEVIFAPVVDPANYHVKKIADLKIEEVRYYPGGATWDLKAVVSPQATPGVKLITLEKFQILACVKKGEEERCLRPQSVPISANLTVLPGPAVAVGPQYQALVDRARNPEAKKTEPDPPTGGVSPAESKGEVGLRIPANFDYEASIEAVRGMLPAIETDNVGFVAFVLTAMFWGGVTLLTPCVFPMVPITVSFFIKQGEKKQHNPLVMAFVYTLTIVAVLGFSALFFLSRFRNLAINPWMNVALGVLFIAFALSLFGMFDLVLPSFLVRFTSAREGRGGYLGVIFMALSFSIVSFTCVAPFLGGFAGLTASGKFSGTQLTAGAFAFAGTFAAPFFLLALFPSLLKKLPKSGSWMNTIKVVMGFLEIAAAFKFLRTAELRWSTPPVLFTYDLVLSVWIGMLILASLYLLNLYRLPHDEPQEHIGVLRLLTAIMCLGVGLYLTPGLFAGAGHERQRPNGIIYAWVDAFLLPEPSASEVVDGEGLVWSGNLRAAIESARSRGDAVFLDFTGTTCTNCKLNEKTVFTLPEIRDLLRKYRLVQLYTDQVPPAFYEAPADLATREKDARANFELETNAFQNEQLPLYVILRPAPGPAGGPVRIVGIYSEGKIDNVKGFKEFLRKGLEQ